MTAIPAVPIEMEGPQDDVALPQKPKPVAKAKVKRGPLLDLDEKAAHKEAERLWKQHAWFHKAKAGESLQQHMWRNGLRFTKLVREQDTDLVKIVVPSGLEALPPVPNKVEELIHNAISILMADPPRPEAEPAGDSPQARDAAQASTRYLNAVSGEGGLNTDQVMYGMLDIAATYSSGFAEVSYSPTHGGYVPLSIEARPSATTRETALTGELPDGSLDARPFVKRYVMPDDTLSEKPKGARLTWQPGLMIDLLNSNQVRFLPRAVTGIADAQGIVIARFTPLSRLKARYPKVAKMSNEQLHELAAWTVDEYERLLPSGYKYEKPSSINAKSGSGEDEAPSDEQLICTLTVYYASHFPTYPKGAYACFGGGKHRLHEGELWFEDEEHGPEALDIPVAQFQWEIDADGWDPYGGSPVRRLGPMDEMRATQYAAALEYLYRFSRPRPYLPMGTTVQPEDLADPEKPIYFMPNGKPEWAPLPDFPQMGMQLIDRIDAEMDNAIGIQGPALGQIAGSVRSAEQQQTLIEQSNIALTHYNNNVHDAFERLHRLILQQARAYLTIPQLVAYRGQDGAYQMQEFKGADFGGTKQIRVRRGSGSMLAPTKKNELIAQEMQLGGITPQEGARLRRDNVSLLVGVQDNPHVNRVRRQLQQWRKGPPKELAQQSPEPQLDPATNQPVIGQDGQPVMTDPIAQAAMQVFTMLPCDEEQAVAMLRHMELTEAVAEVEFYNHPPAWTQALMQAYMQARQASGVQTIAEQQQAAAAQQQAQAQAQQQQAEGQAQEKQADRAAASEQQASKQEFELQREALRSQGRA